MGHQRNKGGNQKISRIKWKWKHNLPELWDTVKPILTEKFIAVIVNIKKSERSQINIMIYLKVLENKNKSNPKVGDGKK
jgi:hypothetical protein